MVSRTTGVRRLSFEPQAGDIQPIYEDIDYACGAIFLYVIVDAFGKQGGLVAVLAF
jgi:hypothetical protein